MPLSGEATKWVKETSQDLHRYHKPVVEARENPRPSLITAKLYGDYTESKEEGDIPVMVPTSMLWVYRETKVLA
jgi:hypothetical protein